MPASRETYTRQIIRTLCNACQGPCPVPAITCSHCPEGISPESINAASRIRPSAINYCSITCRDADAGPHKKACETRNKNKRLERAADLLQAAFYTWREAAFNFSFSKIVRKVDKDGSFELQLYENSYDGEVTPFYPFPHGSVKTQQEKEALLAFDSATDVGDHLRYLIIKLLQGLIKKISTDVILVRRYLPRVRKCEPNEPFNRTHNVLSITDTEGQKFCIDLAGARFGNRRTLAPLEAYESMFGVVRTVDLPLLPPTTTDPDDTEAMPQFHMQETFKAAIDRWEKDKTRNIRQLLSGKQANFDVGKESLMAYIHNDLHQYVDDFRKAQIASSTPQTQFRLRWWGGNPTGLTHGGTEDSSDPETDDTTPAATKSVAKTSSAANSGKKKKGAAKTTADKEMEQAIMMDIMTEMLRGMPGQAK
ncbi:hypothetical protein TI39_contig4309g00012 [Zymoseptoria brevis]|uniref:Suppressor of anucleate metulae protein B n=1 Tax=Zymoseptoria brevis TaxID=1047168 RepID=A0A0F4G7Z3_9PEZI|nr:hypothetical protein TI39_contig4309g00012 [Zymoseptoria brevis]